MAPSAIAFTAVTDKTVAAFGLEGGFLYGGDMIASFF
jgi:hypothetical protein